MYAIRETFLFGFKLNIMRSRRVKCVKTRFSIKTNMYYTFRVVIVHSVRFNLKVRQQTQVVPLKSVCA